MTEANTVMVKIRPAENRRVSVSIPYDKELISVLKSISGRMRYAGKKRRELPMLPGLKE